MNAILSVNCALVSALQRLIGDGFFAEIVLNLYNEFKKHHQTMIKEISPELKEEDRDESKEKVKNILNCFLHFYIF